MANKNKKRVISTSKVTNVSHDTAPVATSEANIPEQNVVEEKLPVIKTPELSDAERTQRYLNLRSFRANGDYMDQIHMFSKKAEVITNLLSDFYNVRLMKHYELLEKINIDLFNVFEALEIAVPEYQITGKPYMNEKGEKFQNLIPNITVLFSSGEGQMRNKNIIITVIDVTIPEHEKNEEFLKLTDNVIQMFVALFPDCAIYSESIEYKPEEEHVYLTTDFMFSHSSILKGLSLTEDEFFALNNEEIYNITEDYEKMEKKSNNMFLNIFQLLQSKNEEIPSKVLLYNRIFYGIDVNGKSLNENGEEVDMSLKFAYPVFIDIELEGEDDSESEEEVNSDVETVSGVVEETDSTVNSQTTVYSGRPEVVNTEVDEEEDIPVSPEGLNDR